MSALVKINGVHKYFTRGSERIDVLKGVTLDIPQGDFLALMGPSGSGKTTLLNLLGGLDQPSSGVVEVGGTNIGKSVVFNHLAGEWVSEVTATASGTKHPVCLVPPGFGETRLESIFGGFELHEWTEPEQPLGDSLRDDLFWRTSPSLPESLLVLDTPDIDSNADS